MSCTEQNEKLEYTKKCLEAFSAKMNERAKEYGMTHTHFNDASGVNNSSCTSDIMKLLMKAYPYAKKYKIWGLEEHTLKTEGVDPREVYAYSKTLRSAGFGSISKFYDVKLGKGGTLLTPKIYNSALIVSVPGREDTDEYLACVAMGADEYYDQPKNVYAAAKSAIDEAMKKFRGEESDESYVCAKSAQVYHVDAEGKKTLLYEKDPDFVIAPASTSKIMTYILACEYLPDFEECLTVTQEVFECLPRIFYQSYIKVGDTVRIYDLIALLMLMSSNLTGYLLAATIGDIILKTEKSAQ
jgi:D-alanyl-D-alanine carboxypeptidase